MVDDDLSCYEQPLNERIRTFLRVEHLLTRLSHHRTDTSHWGRRATVEATLDLLNVMSRHDIRGEASKALVSRRSTLAALAEREDIDTRALTDILAEIDARAGELARIPPQFAAYRLRDDEILKSVNNRTAIAGGTCSFDVPAYRHWLRQREARLGRIALAASLLVPGAGGLLARRPDLSFLGLFFFAWAAVLFLWRDGIVSDPLAIGVAGPLLFAIAGVVAVLGYVGVVSMSLMIRRSL